MYTNEEKKSSCDLGLRNEDILSIEKFRDLFDLMNVFPSKGDDRCKLVLQLNTKVHQHYSPFSIPF